MISTPQIGVNIDTFINTIVQYLVALGGFHAGVKRIFSLMSLSNTLLAFNIYFNITGFDKM